MLTRPEQLEDSWDDQSALVQAESGCKQETLQGVQKALHVRAVLIHCFVETRVAQPNLGVEPIQVRNALNEPVSSLCDLASPEVIFSHYSFDTGPLPWLKA